MKTCRKCGAKCSDSTCWSCGARSTVLVDLGFGLSRRRTPPGLRQYVGLPGYQPTDEGEWDQPPGLEE